MSRGPELYIAEQRAWLEQISRGHSVVVEPMCGASAMLCTWDKTGQLILRPSRWEFGVVCKILHEWDPAVLASRFVSGDHIPCKQYLRDTLIRTRLNGEVVSYRYLQKLEDRNEAAQLWEQIIRTAKERLLSATIMRNVKVRDVLWPFDSENTFYYIDPFFHGTRIATPCCVEFPDIIKFLKAKKGIVAIRDKDDIIADFVKGKQQAIGRMRFVVT